MPKYRLIERVVYLVEYDVEGKSKKEITEAYKKHELPPGTIKDVGGDTIQIFELNDQGQPIVDDPAADILRAVGLKL